jgi:hypothetical protein
VAIALIGYFAFVALRAIAAWVKTTLAAPIYVPLPPGEAERQRVREANEKISAYNSVMRDFKRLPFAGDDAEFVPQALDVMDRAIHLVPIADQPQMLLGAHQIATVLGEALEQRDLNSHQRKALEARLEANEMLGRAAKHFNDHS